MPYGQSYQPGGVLGSGGVGDPFLGGLIKGIGKFAGGILKGAGRAVGIIPPATPPFFPTGQMPFVDPRRAGPVVPVPGIRGAAERAVPGGRTGYMTCPRGYHPDKATGTRCVRNRRMNPANPQALRRALRREEAFIRMARRTGLVTVPKAKRVRRAASKRR